MKIKENFNDNQQQLFVASFYCFLNYDKKNDFVIDFDNVWKWLGYTRKSDGKRVLEKFFTKDIDYKVETIFVQQEENKEEKVLRRSPQNPLEGGRPKETITLNINTFKKFCLKAGTKKADEVHDYYIKLEELLQETINEESSELKLQLQNKEEEKLRIDEEKNKLEEEKNKIEEEKLRIEEENKKLVKKYVKKPKDIIDKENVVYLMTTDEAELIGEYVIGKSVNLYNRKEDYDHNKLHDFKVIYYLSCPNSKIMDIVEASILMKLGEYRCKAGRDVFLLPKHTNITLFTDMFDTCLKFYENVEYVIYPKKTTEKEDKEKEKVRHQKYHEENKEKIYLQQKEYRENNKEIIAELKKEYYENNFETISAKRKKYYEENKEDIIKANSEYYNENKEIILEERKEYYQENKENILEKRKEYYKENYKTKISEQRKKKETCECGMIITHYTMKRHKESTRHVNLMKKKATKV
jgi:hypothetical protein